MKVRFDKQFSLYSIEYIDETTGLTAVYHTKMGDRQKLIDQFIKLREADMRNLYIKYKACKDKLYEIFKIIGQEPE